MRHEERGAWALLLPYGWLLLFFLVPFLIVLKISLADPLLAQPPFTPVLEERDGATILHATLDNYRYLFQDPLYPLAFANSIKLAGATTFLCLLLGLPMAYGIARTRPATRRTLLLLVILPFWISLLLRVYAWMGILSSRGTLSSLLLSAGLIDEPLEVLYSEAAVLIGMTYSYLPFMILPLFAVLERLDGELLEAAHDLGGRPREVFLDIVLPFATPGIIAGCLLVFIPAMGEFVVPALLGGSDTLMIGRLLYDEFFFNRDWPAAAAVAVVLLAVLAVPFLLLQRRADERWRGSE